MCIRDSSIIDLSELGAQPYHYEHLSMVYNGEVYNFKKVKSELIALGYEFISTSDTEVIIKAFHKWGIEAVPVSYTHLDVYKRQDY